jgi:FtsZ-binding cell division protein ZapB
MPTVREILKLKIDRLQERKARLLADVTAVQASIDALQAERATLTQADDDRIGRLVALGAVKVDE